MRQLDSGFPLLHTVLCTSDFSLRLPLLTSFWTQSSLCTWTPLPLSCLQRYWDLLVLISRPDLSSKLLHEDFSVGLPASSVAAAAAAAQAVTQQQQPLSAEGAASWAAAAVAALQLTAQQRQALAAVWSRHSEQAAQRAQRKQELLTAIRSGFLQACFSLNLSFELNPLTLRGACIELPALC